MDFSEIETKVLIIIKDYLNQNRVFKAKAIIPFILKGIKAFNIELNEEGIQKILWRLIRERYVVPGSKLMKETMLENNTRKSIFNHIDKNPGTYLREIMGKLTIGSHEALWHVNILLKFGLIRFSQMGRHKAYFNARLSDKYDKEIFHLGDPTINQIIQALYTNGKGMITNQLAESLGIHFNTVKSGLDKLMDLQLLELAPTDSGQISYLINIQKFKEILDGIEAIKTQIISS